MILSVIISWARSLAQSFQAHTGQLRAAYRQDVYKRQDQVSGEPRYRCT